MNKKLNDAAVLIQEYEETAEAYINKKGKYESDYLRLKLDKIDLQRSEEYASLKTQKAKQEQAELDTYERKLLLIKDKNSMERLEQRIKILDYKIRGALHE